jgi:hypothetical protein
MVWLGRDKNIWHLHVQTPGGELDFCIQWVTGALYIGGKTAGAWSFDSTSLVYLCDKALGLKDKIMFKGFSSVYLKGYVDIKFGRTRVYLSSLLSIHESLKECDIFLSLHCRAKAIGTVLGCCNARN